MVFVFGSDEKRHARQVLGAGITKDLFMKGHRVCVDTCRGVGGAAYLLCGKLRIKLLHIKP